MHKWTQGDALALALHECTTCNGGGWLVNQKSPTGKPCRCCYRSIFRACYNRFRKIQEEEKRIGVRQIDAPIGVGSSRYTFGHKKQEFSADFYLISKRNLRPLEWKLFLYHFLLGAEWSLCAPKLAMDRGTFFRTVYQIEERLGRIFKELKPYPLFPIDEYFSPIVKRRAA